MKQPPTEDPYFNDIPWEIIEDEHGRTIGEVFVTAESLLPRKEREWSVEMSRRGKRKRPGFRSGPKARR